MDVAENLFSGVREGMRNAIRKVEADKLDELADTLANLPSWVKWRLEWGQVASGLYEIAGAIRDGEFDGCIFDERDAEAKDEAERAKSEELK